MPLAAMLAAGSMAGCASNPSAPRTVIVTETAATGSTSEAGTVTLSPDPTSSVAPADTSSASETTATTPSVTAAPFVPINPLQLDCARIMNGTKLAEVFGGGLPGGADRVVEGANDERGITGRLKCQYGVAADKSIVAVTIIFAQFNGAAAATTQIGVTVGSEKSAGAVASTTTVQGYPAQVLLRDGGLLVMNYDTWNLSVVVANQVLDATALPAALANVADYALSRAIT